MILLYFVARQLPTVTSSSIEATLDFTGRELRQIYKPLSARTFEKLLREE